MLSSLPVAFAQSTEDQSLRAPSFALSGGGALGAYQAGVLQYIVTRILPELPPVPLGYVAGTSIGSISGSFLTSYAHNPVAGMQHYSEIWRNLDIREAIPVQLKNIWHLIRPPKNHPLQKAGLADPMFLTKLIVQEIAWLQKRRNFNTGRYQGFAVTATRIRDGRSVVFVETKKDSVLPWNDPYVVSTKTTIGPSHILASSALPLLFPPAPVQNEYYTDGGIRFNTPLSPLLRMGARRIIIIELKNPKFTHASRPSREKQVINPAYVAGKLMQAVLEDRTEHNRYVTDMFNRILETGYASFGKEFLDQFANITEQIRGIPIEHNRIQTIMPSADVSAIAAETTRSILKRKRLGYGLQKVLGWLSLDADSELLGVLLFDGSFAGKLIALGMDDARDQHDAILEVLTGDLLIR